MRAEADDCRLNAKPDAGFMRDFVFLFLFWAGLVLFFFV
jgi:hypothetical protein